jgi:4-amino-4-deoxy-L-arabinose transferase-like glycosyltransferase
VRRPPLPLALLLCVVALVGAAWALTTPAWQGPDEVGHFAHVQTMVENHRLSGGAGTPFSSELRRSMHDTGAAATALRVYRRPEWLSGRDGAAGGAAGRADGGGHGPASNHPPLYYAYASAFYLAARDAGIVTRLKVMRLGSVLWLPVTALGAWLLAGELFGGRRLAKLVAGATAGLWPMIGFVSGSVNPDAMLYALWTLALWCGVAILRRGLTPGRAVGFGALVGAAAITKAAALVLVPPALLVLAYAWARSHDGRRRLAAGAGALALLVPVAGWAGSAAALDRPVYAQAEQVAAVGAGSGVEAGEFASYLWQFYLPRLGFMGEIDHHDAQVADLPLLNTWIGGGSGAFGWAAVWFEPWVYRLIAGILAVVAVAAGLRAARRPWSPERRACAGFLGLVTLLTVGMVHWTDYHFYAAGAGHFAQGRYLFPLVGVGAAVVASVLARRALAGAWIGGLAVLQVASFALVDGARHA